MEARDPGGDFLSAPSRCPGAAVVSRTRPQQLEPIARDPRTPWTEHLAAPLKGKAAWPKPGDPRHGKTRSGAYPRRVAPEAERVSASAVLVTAVADQLEQVARFAQHRFDARVVVGVEREAKHARIVRDMPGDAEPCKGGCRRGN